MKYVDPWTGGECYIFPTGHPDKYPIGYFGSTVLARLPFRHPDEQIDYFQFWAYRFRENAIRMTPVERLIALTHAEELETKIREFQNPETYVRIAAELLDHRATYLHKLTPRDRGYIETENDLLWEIINRKPEPR